MLEGTGLDFGPGVFFRLAGGLGVYSPPDFSSKTLSLPESSSLLEAAATGLNTAPHNKNTNHFSD